MNFSIMAAVLPLSATLLVAGCGSSNDADTSALSDQVAALEKQVEDLEIANRGLRERNGKLRKQNSKLRSQLHDEGSSGNGDPSGDSVVSHTHFVTPSDNIACVMSDTAVRCDIIERIWDPGPKPSDCNSDWGNSVEVGSEGSGQLVCVGDTVRMDGAPVLQYGEVSQVGSFVCESDSTALTCGNRDTGHGFVLSSEGFDPF